MDNKILVYLDLCSFNRPYDDQIQETIILETEAKLYIQDRIKKETIKLAWSYMLEFENSANPDTEIASSISAWSSIASVTTNESNSIIQKAIELANLGFGVKDSIHASCAIHLQAKYFITVDKKLLKKGSLLKEICVINPIDFIRLIEEQYQ